MKRFLVTDTKLHYSMNIYLSISVTLNTVNY